METRSLQHLENERQQSINDYLACGLGHHTADKFQAVSKQSLAACISKRDCDTLAAPS